MRVRVTVMDRFSLLLLEPGEIYFEDFKVVHHTNPEEKNPSVHNDIPGRLKVFAVYLKLLK